MKPSTQVAALAVRFAAAAIDPPALMALPKSHFLPDLRLGLTISAKFRRMAARGACQINAACSPPSGAAPFERRTNALVRDAPQRLPAFAMKR